MNKIKKSYFEDIICAPATSQSPSAVAIVRVSGKGSWGLLKQIFKPTPNISSFKSHCAYYGEIIDNVNIIDSVLVLTFNEGRGFTGEEGFEISSHGSSVIISLIMELLIKHGARLANAGEFSKRAFLNGKLSLDRAEAIMDIVNSSTKKSAMLAVRQLSGGLDKRINKIKSKCSDLLSKIEVTIDYPEEDIDMDFTRLEQIFIEIIDNIDALLQGYKRGKLYRDGVHAVILGRTNAGKSTFFNYLLNKDKAIVSDIHGTTRDFLDGLINIRGIGIRIFDTAGLRETENPIEKEGTKRSLQLSDTADFIIYLVAAGSNQSDDFLEDKINIDRFVQSDKKIILIINKIDMIPQWTLKNIVDRFEHYYQARIGNKIEMITLSALQKTGIVDFNTSVLKILTGDKDNQSEDPLVTNIRHANLLQEAINSCKNALLHFRNREIDICAFDVRKTLDSLGIITGEVTPQDILDKIFCNFCVGK